EQKATIKRLEEKLETKGAAPQAPAVTPIEGGASDAVVGLGKPVEGPEGEGRETIDDPRKKILVYGYVQGQGQFDRSSANVIAQDGRSLNDDRFLVPRARLVAEREWRLAAVLLELDGNTNAGPAVGLQRAEASILYRGDNAPPMAPMLSVTLGQFRIP